MQRELDATRTELRKGILELPQETAESAAQMRRVIVDQIEALAELNRIVARHGRGLDAVEPGAPPHRAGARATACRTAAAPRARSGGGDWACRRCLTPPAAPTRRAEAPSLSPAGPRARQPHRLAVRSAHPRLGGAGARPPRNRAREPAPREPAPRETMLDTGRGDEQPQRHGIDSLDSLAVDIARMIDHDAAAELWDRYKRGERNVFTRKLYTMQGQRAFEEIRRKYRADREFMATVDRYIAEFERLLDEVSRDDRGQVVARTYLTSETGKVYTMLAHAAGRFD